jgi:penicillin-binding protein 2
LYPPGSTFKPFVAATALEASVITPQTTINDTGKITVGGRTFYDYNHAGVGITDLNKAIALSINSYFYTIGGGYGNFQGLGIDRLMAGVSKFGLSNATGIDLPGERKGTLPTPAWKQRVIGEPWYIGDTYNSSIGQGNVLATPLAMATAYSAIANGGTLYHPHLLRGVIAANETKMEPYKPQVIQDHIFPESVLAEIRTAMRTTVTSGSGRSLNSIPAEIAGKTGSAQFIIPHSGGQQGVHAWFGAFAPYNDAKIVLMILLPGAGEGHQVAVPVAKDVLQWYFTRGEVQNKLPVK